MDTRIATLFRGPYYFSNVNIQMLKTQVLHPQILGTLATAGHLSTVLLTDANYPHATKPYPQADIVWANFMPGILDAPTVLKMLCHIIPIERVQVMEPERIGPYAMADNPVIWKTYERILAEHALFTEPLEPLQKPAFNKLCAASDLCLVIATAETAGFANVLLTIGVVPPNA